MNDPPRATTARVQMQQIRNDIDQGVEDMVDSARSMVDWKHYVRTYPWVCLGAAFVLGYWVVPKRSVAMHPDSDTMSELRKIGRLVATPAPTAAHGLVDAFLATVVNVAVRKATACAGHGVERLLGMAADPVTRPAVNDAEDAPSPSIRGGHASEST